VIRYLGHYDDAGWHQLLATLRYFNGSLPVRLYLPLEQRQINLPPDCWIDLDDKILQQIARRYGVRNLALL
jgi:hypothetical protein